MTDSRRGGGVARGGREGRVLAALEERPRTVLALKTGVAASVAWAVAQLLPGPAVDYPFYAPLGAVVTSSVTLVGSARESAQVLLAIVAGAVLGVAVGQLGVPNLVAIGLVVCLGTILGGWRVLGGASSWVPTSALFVLIFGGGDPLGYVVAYAGLVLLGAVIGLGVTAAVPPLTLAPAQRAVAQLRETLIGQLEELADGLQQDHPPSRHEWRDRIRRIDPVLDGMRSALRQAHEARYGNPRLRRRQQDADRLYAQARALESLAFLVEDLTQLIADTEVAEHRRVALGPDLRPPAAAALDQLAAVLRTIDGQSADPAATRRG
ncbi:aromatic acid exporter family protein [Blastococcus sp. SYSU DS0552]